MVLQLTAYHLITIRNAMQKNLRALPLYKGIRPLSYFATHIDYWAYEYYEVIQVHT